MVFRDYRTSLKKTKDPLTPRDDVVKFDVRTNTNDLENNLKPQGCPSDLKVKVKEVVTDYWDMFCEDRFYQHNPGFAFQIDTGNHTPIFCKPLRYVPYESEFMQKLVTRLDENGVVEEDDGI